ncbi:MAG: hypothetical protein U0133_01410 [Gemmatimonadales bacterium]
MQKGQPEDALAHFDIGPIGNAGCSGDARSGAAEALAKLGRYREARQAVDKALVTDQKNEGYQALAAEMDSLLAAHRLFTADQQVRLAASILGSLISSIA